MAGERGFQRMMDTGRKQDKPSSRVAALFRNDVRCNANDGYEQRYDMERT